MSALVLALERGNFELQPEHGGWEEISTEAPAWAPPPPAHTRSLSRLLPEPELEPTLSVEATRIDRPIGGGKRRRSGFGSGGDDELPFERTVSEEEQEREDSGLEWREAIPLEEEDLLLQEMLYDYRIIEHIASGAFCHVYRARHQTFGMEVAIKVLRPRFAGSEVARRRLLREGRVLGWLTHPHVVRVLECVDPPDGPPFLVLELLTGKTLRAYLNDEVPVPEDLAAEFTRQLASGLSAIHSLGLVHRDLKPSNVMVIETQGRPWLKIIDLGIVRLLYDEEDLTGEVRLLGTPKYMAPEQIADSSEVDFSADLYALGALLYAMLEGSPPFAGTPSEILTKHLITPPEPRRLSQESHLGRIAMTLLEKSPVDRLPSAIAVVEAIDGEPIAETAESVDDMDIYEWCEVLGPEPTTIPAEGLPWTAPSRPRRSWSRFFGGVALGVVLAILALVLPVVGDAWPF